MLKFWIMSLTQAILVGGVVFLVVGPRGPFWPPPPQNANRMVDDALKFDADNDGKLDRAELQKWAEDFPRRRRGPGNQGGPPAPVRPARPEVPAEPEKPK